LAVRDLVVFPHMVLPLSVGRSKSIKALEAAMAAGKLLAVVAQKDVSVEDPGAGAIVLFSGVVREETGGRQIKFLEYEGHAAMATAKMHEIAAAVRARFPGVRKVALVHRVGRLEIGESSVLIAVSSAHRREAFEACHFAIDTLKETVPIWKKEHFEDGEVWVGRTG